MNLQPINQPEPVFQFDCSSCGRPFLSTTPGACANLDGTSFAAYFCGPCASVIQDAARDLAESPAYGTANDSELYTSGAFGAMKRFACAALLCLLSLPAFAAPQPCRINVNAATQAELELFARTGPALALRLTSGRPYKALEAVDAVKGVGPSWMAVNGPHVAFSGPTTCAEKVPSPRAPKVAAQAPKL